MATSAGDPDAIPRLVHLLAASFGPDEPWPSLVAAVFERPESVLDDETVALVAYVGGEPAAASVSYLLQGIGVVGWVGTVERHRGRGLGALVTEAGANALFSLGASAVVLQSSPMAAPLYARIGFREATRYRLWVGPGQGRAG